MILGSFGYLWVCLLRRLFRRYFLSIMSLCKIELLRIDIKRLVYPEFLLA